MLTFIIPTVFLVLIALASIKLDLMIRQHRGHAQPDNPDQDNPPVITGSTDAMAHLQIDRTKSSKKKK